MSEMDRRRWLVEYGLFVVAGSLPSRLTLPTQVSGRLRQNETGPADFQPKSMLHVPETKVPRSRYPVIDIHTHLSIRAKSVNGVGLGKK